MSQKNKPASIYTALRMPADLRQMAERRAASKNRSLSNYIKHLISIDLGIAEEPTAPYDRRVMRETLSPKQIEEQTRRLVKYSEQKKPQRKK
jgi:hypothetical protein